MTVIQTSPGKMAGTWPAGTATSLAVALCNPLNQSIAGTIGFWGLPVLVDPNTMSVPFTQAAALLNVNGPSGVRGSLMKIADVPEDAYLSVTIGLLPEVRVWKSTIWTVDDTAFLEVVRFVGWELQGP